MLPSSIESLSTVGRGEARIGMTLVTPANGAGLDGFFGWVLIRVLLDGWKRVTL